MIVSGKKIAVTNDITTNKANIISAIRQASAEKSDILLVPEGCLSGYTDRFEQRELLSALHEVVEDAKTNQLGLALGTCFYEEDGLCYNQVRFYDKEGSFMGFHSKILKCGSLEDDPKGEINRYATGPLKVFNWGNQKIGGIICNDMWANPQCTPMPDTHISQLQATLGAKVLFHAVNGGRDASQWSTQVVRNFHESNLRMRARAGKLWIVTVDNSHPCDLPSSCPSGVINPDGNWVVKADDVGESFFTCHIDLSTSGS
jgi:predicted amidohydrolase